MVFEITLERKINAEIGFAFDWWTDLSSEDVQLVEPLKKREIISKSDDIIILRDSEQMYWMKMNFNVRVRLERPGWIAEYKGKQATARSEYLLTSKQGVTMLSYHTRIVPSGFLTNLFSPLVKIFVKRIFSGEMDSFIKSLEKDYQLVIK